MSYADAAASGPKQSPDEPGVSSKLSLSRDEPFHCAYRAPAVPEVANTESSTQSLIDVDSPHISSVPSDFESQSVKTDTQAKRLDREAEADELRAETAAKQAKEKANAKAKAAKSKAGGASKCVRENAGNPVVLGNFVALGALGTLLGIGGYRKYVSGELSWKVMGISAGAVGLFATGDYFLSKYLFKKYPPKK
ncbi:hypothetical protein P152DRAFT_476426 [Eremomyces bilateralis CBS 781.70]|uniref:Mitochondrial outer membrane protein OM14 C-terminal domain-containing protein n=1 Tax=Eremomyces bilateralis CBS 781.70 TaxID=1392243 RepID=A0A6G1FUP2_9PEZI|nr:uncharacterized protein P152DRAFT_476426 [Eremomyces bilateralis CBS 781.70]KAF1809527.1 hypothetical protein P152DRAFT_476426 [Eremomyces bilateralis CBS 781.70]